MDYYELLEKYNLLLKENQKLIKENKDLRIQLKLSMEQLYYDDQSVIKNNNEIQYCEPKGGLGNLIALPLQYHSRKNNNSVFIDENFEPYKDQWQYLSNINKFTEDDIGKYISELCNGNERGDLRSNNDDELKPWEINNLKHNLNQKDFPKEVTIIKSNMLYINKDGFTNKVLNIIKRLSSFKNPEFYKSQAMRLSTYDKPRIISLCEETSKYLCILMGCEIELSELFLTYNIDVKWIDNTNLGKQINVKFIGQLREEQEYSLIILVQTLYWCQILFRNLLL